MKRISCSYEHHAEQILAIFNDAILTSTALYDYQARTMDNMVRWFEAKAAGNYPVIGYENEAGELMGFAEPQSIAVTQMNLVVTFYANGGKFALHAESEGHYDNVVDTFDQMAKWATKLGFPQDPFQLVKSIAHPNLHFMPKSDLADFTARKISKGEFEPYPWWIWGQI